MNAMLKGKKVAILAANGFNENDMLPMQRALIDSGAKMTIISNQNGLINAWNGQGWGLNFLVDANLSSVLAADYDMLFVPGGERSVAKLCETAHTKRIVRGFMDARKPVAMLGEAVTLVEMAGREMAANVMTDDSTNADFIVRMLDSFAGVADNVDNRVLEAA